jgi:hypothetical protein
LDHGQATDKDTVDNDDDKEEEGGEEEEEDNVNANDEPPSPEVPLELQEHDAAIAMFMRTLLFSRGAALHSTMTRLFKASTPSARSTMT